MRSPWRFTRNSNPYEVAFTQPPENPHVQKRDVSAWREHRQTDSVYKEERKC